MFTERDLAWLFLTRPSLKFDSKSDLTNKWKDIFMNQRGGLSVFVKHKRKAVAIKCTYSKDVILSQNKQYIVKDSAL